MGGVYCAAVRGAVCPGAPALPSERPACPGDVGKRLRLSETAVDVLASGKETHATVSYRPKRAVAAWPRGVSPRIDFVYGVPEPESAATRELFDFSPPFANRADGRVTVACAIDRGRYSRACGHSRSFMTPNLSRGRHTVRVRVSNGAGSRTTSYSWKVVALPAPTACSSCLTPTRLDANGHPMSWDWQLQGRLVFRKVDMFDIDGFDTPTGVVEAIHRRAGRTLSHERAICYLSLGSWERYRPDERRWPRAALGLTLGGYPDEHWVDVRQLRVLEPLIDARLRMCARKGFDGVEVDNIDAWDNRSCFPLTPQDAEAWLAAIADETHKLGMFVLWKNDPYLASFGERYFDGALSEQCFSFRECTARQNDGIRFFPGMRCNMTSLRCGVGQFAAAGKWVGEVEYKWGVPHEDGVVCDPGQHCILSLARRQLQRGPLQALLRHGVWRLPIRRLAPVRVRRDRRPRLVLLLASLQVVRGRACRSRRGRMRPRGPATCGRAIESGRVQPGPPERPRHVIPSPGAGRGTHARRRVRGVRRAATRLRRAA